MTWVFIEKFAARSSGQTISPRPGGRGGEAAVKRRSKIKERRAHAVEAVAGSHTQRIVCREFVVMKSKLDAVVTRRDTVVKRLSAAGRGEVDGKFAASHHFDAAACGGPNPRTRRVKDVPRGAHHTRRGAPTLDAAMNILDAACCLNYTATDLVEATFLTPSSRILMPTNRSDVVKCTAALRPHFRTAPPKTALNYMDFLLTKKAETMPLVEILND
ncbi:hypothetical protein B0H19DRAFT_1081448 [Mycena capillaripes]|nr:hypothetical protein B0H19DRAFT_1081448 [Mycena capillaripes]